MINLELFPTLAGTYLTSFMDLDNEHLFWCPESPVYVPNVMISYGQVLTSTVNDKLRYYGRNAIKCNPKVFVDSGGLQATVRGLKVDVLDLVEFQNSIGDWGLILDDAPAGVNEKVDDIPKSAFETMAKNTRNYVEIMLDHTKIKLWAILHGNTMEQIKLWYDIAIKDYLDKFYGVAIAFRPKTNLVAMANQLSFLYDKGVRNIHILGTANKEVALVSAKLLQDGLFDYISMDTSTFSFNASLGIVFFYNKYIHAPARRNYELLCQCPACSKFKSLNEKYIDYKWYVEIALHNLWRVVDYINYVKNLATVNMLDSELEEKGLMKYVKMAESARRWL